MSAYTGNPAADMAAWLAGRPAPATRAITAAEVAAEDYWAGVGEDRRDEALMGELDDRHAQDVADDWTEREAG